MSETKNPDIVTYHDQPVRLEELLLEHDHLQDEVSTLKNVQKGGTTLQTGGGAQALSSGTVKDAAVS